MTDIGEEKFDQHVTTKKRLLLDEKGKKNIRIVSKTETTNGNKKFPQKDRRRSITNLKYFSLNFNIIKFNF